MRFLRFISTVALLITGLATAQPVGEELSETVEVPSEAFIGYLDFGATNDVAILPISNKTNNGLLFVNTTLYNQATKGEKLSDFTKRDANPDAEAEAWHWVKIRKGQGLFRRSADASPEAEAWHWVRLRKGQGLFRRSADASPEAEAWHWVRLRKGQGLF